ncbi:MAG TPA: winged helix-turn-helix domain-containing protein [Candidatus Methylomirabilis sp.]|nr:winged helix-turn-helix domain-containing protein [Candidatus Methylomirabilis sp.]
MERYRFGLFELDAVKRELRREGTVVRLQAQPALALACLVKSAGQVVSREELCKAVWGKETFVDFERGLNFCIAQIREALNDDAVAPRYVRTIPKRGYQFIAPIEPLAARQENAEAEREPEAQPEFVASGLSGGNVALLVGVVVLAAFAFGLGYRLLSTQRTAGAVQSADAARQAIVAVVRFDNETSDVAMTRFADGLTDTVVEQLTAASRERYAVIGNAEILRLPRDLRDLNEIASSLGARYVVLGQVQASGSQTRILAHLIRMPGQTHIWVVRVDRAIAEPLAAEAELAQKIAADFSERIAKDSSGTPLPPFPNQ